MCQSHTHNHAPQGELCLSEAGDSLLARRQFESGSFNNEKLNLDLRDLEGLFSLGKNDRNLGAQREVALEMLSSILTDWSSCLMNLHKKLAPLHAANSKSDTNLKRCIQEIKLLNGVSNELRERSRRTPASVPILGAAIERYCIKEDMRIIKGVVFQLAFLAEQSPFDQAKDRLVMIADRLKT